MLPRNRRLIRIISIIYLFNNAWLYSCLITITNDTDPRILILNKEDGSLISLAKYEKRRFGNAHTHAIFDIYIQSGKRVTPKAYSCEQKSCNRSNIINLKCSDIKKRTDVTKFFTIVEHEPLLSMAQRVTKNIQQCEMCD